MDSVDQSKGMLGTFAPQPEPYVHTLDEETTPSGVLARGIYSAKLKVCGNEVHVWANIDINIYIYICNIFMYECACGHIYI